MGTALTPEQAAKLKALAPKVVLCYDGDPAGRNAARSALSHLLAQGLEVAVARLPAGEDPDDVRRQEGPRGARRADCGGAPLSPLAHGGTEPAPRRVSRRKTRRIGSAQSWKPSRQFPTGSSVTRSTAASPRRSGCPSRSCGRRTRPTEARGGRGRTFRGRGEGYRRPLQSGPEARERSEMVRCYREGRSRRQKGVCSSCSSGEGSTSP